MRRIIRQIIRGCGDLPYVGDHPGTIWIIAFIFMGGMAGASGGLWGFLGGAVFSAIFFGPLYLYGAYERAKDSDNYVRQYGLREEE